MQRMLVPRLGPLRPGVRTACFGLWLFVFVTRFGYAMLDGVPTGPGAEVERAAASLARSGTIADIYSDTSGPSAHVAPLYPLFLGALYRVAGWNTVAGRVAQELCASAATGVGIVLLPSVSVAAGMAPVVGWIAAVLMAVLPLNLWVESSGSWEQPYTAIVLLLLVREICRLNAARWRSLSSALACGILVGLAGLLTPAVLPAIALMLLSQVFEWRRNPFIVRRMGFVLVIAVVVIAPWIVRNALVFQAFIPLRSNFGLELAIGNHDGANGKTYGTWFEDASSPFFQMHPISSQDERARLQAAGEWPYMQEKQRVAVKWIREHPQRFASLTLVRLRLFWFPPTDLWTPFSSGRLLKAGVASTAGALALIGVLWMIAAGQTEGWILGGVLLGSSLTYAVTHVDPRHRYPVAGLFILVALHTLALASARVRRGRGVRGLNPVRSHARSETI
jgi:hypothetical protein